MCNPENEIFKCPQPNNLYFFSKTLKMYIAYKITLLSKCGFTAQLVKTANQSQGAQFNSGNT